MRFLRSSKCSKTAVELAFITEKANSCIPRNACSVFYWKYPFWVNLVQKLKIVSLNWNFVLRLIQICRIPWWYSTFMFSTGHTFLGKFDPKNQNCLFELNFGYRLIWICRNQWCCSLLLFLTTNILLGQIWFKNSKLFV